MDTTQPKIDVTPVLYIIIMVIVFYLGV